MAMSAGNAPTSSSSTLTGLSAEMYTIMYPTLVKPALDDMNKSYRAGLISSGQRNSNNKIAILRIKSMCYAIAKATITHINTNAQINFTIASSNSPYMIYNAIIDRDNSAYTTTLEQTSTVYVPQDERAKYEHRSSFYVDVIAKDNSGIKEVRTHTEPNAYEFEKAEDADEIFNIPKFTWE